MLRRFPSYKEECGINSIKFNQNFECFICCFNNGFCIFNSVPLKQLRHEVISNGVICAEMLYRCNYVALVGSFDTKQQSKNEVLIFDYNIGKVVIRLDMKEPVVGVRLRRDLIIVILESTIRLFSFCDIPIQIFSAKTLTNAMGLCAISNYNARSLIAYPSSYGVGWLEILNVWTKEWHRFKAHSHRLYAMSFNSDASLIATASEQGTIIRVYDIVHNQILRELRRGANPAKVSCINFSVDSTLLCVSSDHATIHIFELNKFNDSRKNGLLKGDVSDMKLRLSNSPLKGICQCAFGKDSNSVIALGLDGSYYDFSFDLISGKFYQQNYCFFTELNTPNISGSGVI